MRGVFEVYSVLLFSSLIINGIFYVLSEKLGLKILQCKKIKAKRNIRFQNINFFKFIGGTCTERHYIALSCRIAKPKEKPKANQKVNQK